MVKDIIRGHVNEALSLNKELSEQRMAICRACPLYLATSIGPICNSNLYYNTQTGDTSSLKKEGFIKGCGCRLKAKTTLKDSSCPTGQW